MKKFLYMIGILVFFTAGSVFAQTTQELRIGSFLSGSIGQGQDVWYSVRATQAGVLTVFTESNIDTYLEAYDAQRNLITENDDGDDLNAKINILTQANTTYLFKLRGYSESVTGSFRIFADSKAITELRIGSPVSGNISTGGENWYSIRAVQNGILIVETSGSTDTYLIAYDEFNNYITADDDSAGNGNAKVKIPVVSGKTYLIALRGNSNYAAGAYRIQVSSPAAPSALAVGSFLNGNITQGGEYWYSVRAAQNGFIIIETSGNTDTYLEAYDENYNLIASDDDSAGNGNAKVRIQVSAGKTYTIALRGYSGVTTGAYRIQASVPAAPVVLNVGSFLNGSIAAGSEYWYNVRAAQSGYITVETSGNTDTYLEVYDENYNFITSDDDSAGSGNARVRIDAVAGKTFYFLLRGYSSETTGAYRILANSQPYPAPAPITVGSFLNGNIQYDDEIWYSVRTTRNGRLTVETTGSTDTVLDIYTSNYQHIERNDDNEDYNARIIINANANTTYIFRLTCYSPGPYRIYAIME